MSLTPGARVGLLGPNGAGKSTLIKLLAGELAPLEGLLQPAQYLHCAYFAQHQLEQLRLSETPLWHLRQLDAKAREQELRDFLGGFGFVGDRVLDPVEPFSGGEKARLVLALLVYRRPNLLLLDEPTNHLDLDMRLALAGALQDFAGALVVVSHDRHLLRVCTDELWLVHAGGVTEFDGDLDDYPAWLSAHAAASAPSRPAAADTADNRKARKRLQAQQRARLQPLTRRLQAQETLLEGLQAELAQLQVELARPELYEEDNKARMLRLMQEKRDLDQRIEQAELDWLEAGEALEQAQAAEQD